MSGVVKAAFAAGEGMRAQALLSIGEEMVRRGAIREFTAKDRPEVTCLEWVDPRDIIRDLIDAPDDMAESEAITRAYAFLRAAEGVV